MASLLPLPLLPLWFWNDTTVRREGIRERMRMCVEAGYGGLGILPFGSGFSPSYLSEEYGFPSGSVGARNSAVTSAFAARHPDLLLKRLDKAERMASGPGVLEIRLPAVPSAGHLAAHGLLLRDRR